MNENKTYENNHSGGNNNNYNLTNPINEDSNSLTSITNSSKDEDIIYFKFSTNLIKL